MILWQFHLRLLLSIPPMKLLGLGACPLNSAPEKSKPGCSA